MAERRERIPLLSAELRLNPPESISEMVGLERDLTTKYHGRLRSQEIQKHVYGSSQDHKMSLISFDLLHLLFEELYERLEGEKDSKAHRQEIWNVDGILLVIRKVEQLQEAFIEKRCL